MKHALRVAGAVLAVLAVVVMAGCSAAMSPATIKAEPEPTPEPAPPPGIQGTWSRETDYIENGSSFTESVLLTFVSGGRFIESWERTEAGEVVDDWTERGGWTDNDGTSITRRWHVYATDSFVSFEKRYYWGNAEHSVLYVECWRCDHIDSALWRLTRVANPLPDLEGTWVFDGGDDEQSHSMTIAGADISYTVVEVDGSEFTVTGTGTLNPDTLAFHVTGATNDDGELLFDDGQAVLALAPAHNAAIVVSTFWEEQDTEERPEETPYGGYFRKFTREVVTQTRQ